MVFKWISLGQGIEQGKIVIIVGEVVTCYQWYMYTESLMFFILLLSFQLRLDKPEKIKVRKAFGGHKKIKGIKVKTGLYVCNSLGKVCLLW